jgi:hypothetical protein
MRFRNDTELLVPFKGQQVHLGLYDAFEANRLIFQLEHPLSDFAKLRYGAYAGQPGLGVDLKLAPGFYLKGDVFGLNEPCLDLRAQYEFKNGMIGWAELKRVFRTNSPALGIGIRR